MSMQKNKGSSFERAVSSTLSEVFNLPFSRTLSSGAFVGGKNKHRKDRLSDSVVNASLGDISCPRDNGWNLVIECKFYQDFDFKGVMKGYCLRLSGWIDEVRYDTDGNLNHIVVFRINRSGNFLVLPYIKDYADKLVDNKVSLTTYDHAYYANEEAEAKEDISTQLYIVLDFDMFEFEDEDNPEIQAIIKQYILHLAKELDNG